MRDGDKREYYTGDNGDETRHDHTKEPRHSGSYLLNTLRTVDDEFPEPEGSF